MRGGADFDLLIRRPAARVTIAAMKRVKDRFLTVRLDDKTRSVLNALAEVNFSRRGEVVRQAIWHFARSMRGPAHAAVVNFEREWESFRRELARPVKRKRA